MVSNPRPGTAIAGDFDLQPLNRRTVPSLQHYTISSTTIACFLTLLNGTAEADPDGMSSLNYKPSGCSCLFSAPSGRHSGLALGFEVSSGPFSLRLVIKFTDAITITRLATKDRSRPKVRLEAKKPRQSPTVLTLARSCAGLETTVGSYQTHGTSSNEFHLTFVAFTGRTQRDFVTLSRYHVGHYQTHRLYCVLSALTRR